MSKKIVFKINKNGSVLIDKVEGYGSACKDITSLIEQALGSADESSREYTAEYCDSSSSSNDTHEETQL
jgi:hypothetical protein